MNDPVGPGSLKCLCVSSPRRQLHDIIKRSLVACAGAGGIRHLFGDVFLVHTEADAAALRDILAAHLEADESAFVVEFERWSASGPAADRRWLLRRGH
ncbi:MAG TPA: hypothetical protein VEZ14_10860 [Dehalococcoidia bacterium]|nr:hypothetical protein [Dehalococcoidia bacterium]